MKPHRSLFDFYALNITLVMKVAGLIEWYVLLCLCIDQLTNSIMYAPKPSPRSLALIAATLLFTFSSFSQNLEESPRKDYLLNDISEQGVFNVSTDQFISTQFGSFFFDGEKDGSFNTQGYDLGVCYNIIDNLMVGLELSGSRFQESPESSNDFDRFGDFSLNLDVGTYFPVGPQQLVLEGTIGFGKSNFKEEYDNEVSENSNNLFNYGLELRYPLPLGNSGTYISPRVGWWSEIESYEDDNFTVDFTYSEFNLGAGLESFFTCAMFDPCQKDIGEGFYDNRYDLGDLFLDGSSGLNVGFGKDVTSNESSGQTFESESSVTDLQLQLAGGYYVTQFIAATLALNVLANSQKFKESDNKYTDSQIAAALGILWHLQMINRNMFVRGDIGFGSLGFSSDINGNSNSDSESLFNYYAGVGYYLFLTNTMAFTPSLGYSSNSIGDPAFRASGMLILLALTMFPFGQ